jgi:hypothetical protein
VKPYFIIIIGCIFLSVAMLSCTSEKPAVAPGSSVDEVLKTKSVGKNLKSTDGSCEITVPDNWTEETTLNKDAKIQGAMRLRDAYLVVFVDQKDKYGDIDLAAFAEGAHKKLTKRLISPVGTSGAQLTVGGLPAIQYELTGQAGGSTFTYYQTLVAGPLNYYEILAWTPKAQVDKNQSLFQETIKTFKETTK